MKADARTEADLLGLLKRFSEAFSNRDKGRVLRLFESDADLVFIGSSYGPVFGRSELEALLDRVFSRPKTYSWDYKSWSILMSGQVAWLTAQGLIHARGGDQDVSRPYRLTAVFEKRHSKWLWIQYHGSEPKRVRKSRVPVKRA